MSSPATHAAHAPEGFIRRYIFSLDHKVIGVQYYFLGLFSVFIGLTLSVIMRFHMVNPNVKVALFEKLWPTAAAGGVMTPELYLSLMTMHGTIMVFFVLTTVPQSGFGNYFLPIQIGAEDMAFPVLNMMSFWTTFVSLCVMISAFFVQGGAPLSGWTAYPPLSAVGRLSGPGEGLGQTLWIISIAIFCGASLMGAINFIATTVDLRCHGMKLMRMPLTCWSWLVTAILGLLGFAVLLSAGILLLLDRLAGTSFFLPAGLMVNDRILTNNGGSPLLWQHLFWFFGHPEVYIAIVPGMGVTSHLLSNFSRKPIFGYKAMVYAILSIGFLGFLVWGHHMFMSGMNPYSAMAFATLTMCIGVPSAIKTFNWLGTLWGGQIHFTTAMLFALGFVSLFVTGGVSGIFLGQPALDLYFHDTYFVVGHFHMIMGVAAMFGMFAGTFYWFPKVTGRLLNEALGKIHFYLTFIGVYCIFVPMHFLGIAGNPRRYADFTNVEYLGKLMPIHQFMSVAAYITAAAQLLFLINLFWSIRKGPRASINPWNATSLEWTVSSPPPHDNFNGIHPVVNNGPYEYSVPGAARDFIMQTDPPVVPEEA
jgi:cytochrome c oxidase subunit 1